MKKNILSALIILFSVSDGFYHGSVAQEELQLDGETVRIIVKYKINSERAVFQQESEQTETLAKELTGEIELKNINSKILEFELGDETPEELLNTVLDSNSNIEYAELDKQVFFDAIPNDPLFPDQWHHLNSGQLGGVPGADIGTPQAWDIATGEGDVVVAVMDSGVNYSHPDLSENIWINELEYNGAPGVDDDGNGYVDDVHGIDTGEDDSDPMDIFGHGTAVAGIISASGNNGIGLSGVSWQTKLLPIKFSRDNGSGFVSDILEGIDYILELHDSGVNIKVSNNSWGIGFIPSETLEDAISDLDSRGILFVTSAGNSARDNDAVPTYPASYELPNVVTVSSTDRNDDLSANSNFGASSVDIAAPGEDIWTTGLSNSYVEQTGTSFSAPMVSGAAALILSRHKWQSAPGSVEALIENADPVESLLGTNAANGRLNVASAMAALESEIISPEEGSEISGSSFVVRWDSPEELTSFRLSIGTTAGGTQLGEYFINDDDEFEVTNLPQTSQTIFVSLAWFDGASWILSDSKTYSYQAHQGPALIFPQSGATLQGETVLFKWDAVEGASRYRILLGTSEGGSDIGVYGMGSRNYGTVRGIGTNGSGIYVTIEWEIDGEWVRGSSSLFGTKLVSGGIFDPAPGSEIDGNAAIFRWSELDSALAYRLRIGTTPKSGNIASIDSMSSTAIKVQNLPSNGLPMYASLYWLDESGWHFFHSIEYSTPDIPFNGLNPLTEKDGIFVIEAEDFDFSNWSDLGEGYWDTNFDQNVFDPDAAAGQYMISGPYLPGDERYFSSPEDIAASDAGEVKVPNLTYSLYSENGGDYDLWVRWFSGANATSQDSFYLTVNDETVPSVIEADSSEVHLLSTGWVWRKANLSVTLHSGINHLTIWKREGGTILDRLVLARSDFASPGVDVGPVRSRRVAPQMSCATGSHAADSTSVNIEAETPSFGSDDGLGKINEAYASGTAARISGTSVAVHPVGSVTAPADNSAPWNCYSFTVTHPTDTDYSVWAYVQATSSSAESGVFLAGVGGSAKNVTFRVKNAPEVKWEWEWVKIRNFKYESDSFLGVETVVPRKMYAWIGAGGTAGIAIDKIAVLPTSAGTPD